MEKVYASGRVVFSLAIIALGVEHFVCAHVPGDAVPVIPWEPARPLWAYLTGGILIAAGLAIAWGVKPRLAAIVLGVLFLAAAFLQQLPQAWRLPLDIAQRTVFLEPLALGSAAFTLAAQPAAGGAPPRLRGAGARSPFGAVRFRRLGRRLRRRPSAHPSIHCQPHPALVSGGPLLGLFHRGGPHRRRREHRHAIPRPLGSGVPGSHVLGVVSLPAHPAAEQPAPLP